MYTKYTKNQAIRLASKWVTIQPFGGQYVVHGPRYHPDERTWDTGYPKDWWRAKREKTEWAAIIALILLGYNSDESAAYAFECGVDGLTTVQAIVDYAVTHHPRTPTA